MVSQTEWLEILTNSEKRKILQFYNSIFLDIRKVPSYFLHVTEISYDSVTCKK